MPGTTTTPDPDSRLRTENSPTAAFDEMVYPRESIRDAIAGLAAEIADWIRSEDTPVVPVIVMKGGVFPGTKLLQDLSEYDLGGRLKDFAYVTSHRSTETADFEPRNISFEGDRVLFIDEICDGGDTIQLLVELAARRGATETEAVTLITRTSAEHEPKYQPRWTGFKYDGPDWFVGEGLDCEGMHRARKDICIRRKPGLQGMISGLSEFREKHPEISFTGMDRFSVSADLPPFEAAVVENMRKPRGGAAEGERALLAWEEMIEELRRTVSWNGNTVTARIPQREVTARGLLMADVASKLLYDLPKEAAEKEGYKVNAEAVYFYGSSTRGRLGSRDFDLSVLVSIPSRDYMTHPPVWDFTRRFAEQAVLSSEYAEDGIKPQIERMKWHEGGFRIHVHVGEEPTKNRPFGSGHNDYHCSTLVFLRARAEKGDSSSRPLAALFTPLNDFLIRALYEMGKEI